LTKQSLRPALSAARAPLTREIATVNEHGEHGTASIPAERDLTVYVDKRELVTLMTLGAQPELLVLGYLRNQRLVNAVSDIASITVDWDVNAASVVTHSGIDNIDARTAKKVVTTGCGQGSVFGGLMDEIDSVKLPDTRITQADLYSITNAIRLQETTYKSAGSVHGCALFAGTEMLMFVEDVGRHNAIDTIAGWLWMQTPEVQNRTDKLFYTTGRLTSEMVIKAAQMGIAIVVSRSGITQMGHEVAERVGLCTIGRAMNKHFLCYTAAQRLQLDPSLAGPKVAR
jgi:FdhD protein